jgi:hypothetical protein
VLRLGRALGWRRRELAASAAAVVGLSLHRQHHASPPNLTSSPAPDRSYVASDPERYRRHWPETSRCVFLTAPATPARGTAWVSPDVAAPFDGLDNLGKSSLVKRYIDGPNESIEAYHPTIEQTHHKELSFAGRSWKVKIIDTAGQVSSPAALFPPPASLPRAATSSRGCRYFRVEVSVMFSEDSCCCSYLAEGRPSEVISTVSLPAGVQRGEADVTAAVVWSPSEPLCQPPASFRPASLPFCSGLRRLCWSRMSTDALHTHSARRIRPRSSRSSTRSVSTATSSFTTRRTGRHST